MKKWIRIAALTVLVVTSVTNAKSQAYKMSIGGIVGNMEGASFKMFFTEKIALEADLGVKFVRTTSSYKDSYIGRYRYPVSFGTFELNPNIVYQGGIKSWNAGEFGWFAGGGVSIGYAFGWGLGGYGIGSGKFGVNAMGGVEFTFAKIPLTLQFDFRPGYGLLFGNGYTQSLFDWTVGLSARYVFRR